MPTDNITPLHPDRYFVAPDAQVEALRLSMVGLLEACLSFAEEVADAEAECGAMSMIEIERHLIYLRDMERRLGRKLQ